MYTLPRYNISVAPKQLSLLNRNVWMEDAVPAYVDLGKGAQKIRLKYRGAHTRLYDKKSFYLKMNDKEWHLNADAVDPSHIRSKLSFDWFAALSVLSPKATHVTVTLNGVELGVYTLLESVDRHFLHRRRLPVGDLFYAVDNRANFSLTVSEGRNRLKKCLTDGYELKEQHGAGAKRHLEQFLWKLNTVPEDRLASWLLKTVEVHHYLRWLAGIVLTSNADGFIHNYALYRHPKTGKWWIIPWDYDGTWGRDCYGRTMPASEVPLFGYNRLTERILAIPAFRRHYLQLVAMLLRRYFTPRRLIHQGESLMAQVRPTVYRMALGRSDVVQKFEFEKQVLQDYVIQRRYFLQKSLEKQNRFHLGKF